MTEGLKVGNWEQLTVVVSCGLEKPLLHTDDYMTRWWNLETAVNAVTFNFNCSRTIKDITVTTSEPGFTLVIVCSHRSTICLVLKETWSHNTMCVWLNQMDTQAHATGHRPWHSTHLQSGCIFSCDSDGVICSSQVQHECITHTHAGWLAQTQKNLCSITGDDI